jgi:fucose permease
MRDALSRLAETRSLLFPVLWPAVTSPSAEPVVKSRLLPRISFRVLLAAMTLGAIFFAIAQAAGQGVAFALAVQVALGFLLFCFLAFAVLFLAAWVVAILVVDDIDPGLEGSPFAEDRLPPQLLPPREPTP